MENDSIVITAKLNVDASEALIQKDLETLEGRLKSSPLKISCVINEDSISQMQSQLNSLTNNLTINLGNANVENAKVEIIPDIKKGVLEQQAKQLQQELGLLFPYGETEKLREELKGYLNDYQKAYQAENGYGEQAQAHMEKIVDFANKYRQEMVLINETLKAEQDRIKEIRKEQQQVFITAEQMVALNREAKQNGTTAQAMLNSVLPNRGKGQAGWYSDINKLPASGKPYYWSDFVDEVNNINPFHEIANGGDIVQGIRDLTEFMSKSFTSVDNTIEKNRAVWEQWAETIKGTVGEVTGRNPFADFLSEFEEILSYDEFERMANSMENVQERVVQTVNVIQQSLGGNDGLSNVNFRISNQAIETFINELNQLDVQGINIDQLRERLQSLGVTITSITPKFTQVGRSGQQFLNNLTVKGVDSANNIITYVENFSKKTGEFTEASTKVEQSFAKIRQEEERVKSETEALQKTYNDFLKLQGTFDLYSRKYGDNESLTSQFEELHNLIQGFDNTAPIERQRESIIRIDSALKLLKVDIDDINRAATQTTTNVERLYPNLTFTSGDSSSAILARAKEQLNSYFNAEGIESTASRVKRAVEDASGSLNRFFVQVEREDGAVETLTYALNQQANAYEYLGKITREADNSTDFRHVDISTQIELQTQKLEKFATDVSKSSEASSVLREDIASLRNELSQVGDTNAMKAFLDNFDIAKAKFQSLNSETKVVEASIKKLDQLLNNTQFRNNANNPAVSQQRADIEALRTEYEGLLRELSNANDPQSLQDINARLAELKPQFDAVVQSSTELNNSLKDSDASAKFAAKLNQLKNQVEIFANTNRRATESLRVMRDGETTFAQGFQNIKDALSRENLDATGLQRLTEQFRNFRGEADAAGLTVSRFFQSMQSQLRMVLQRWISLYAVIGYIRKMIDNVKELDNAMINLRRVTDETDAGYERFLKNANELARTMKTTTSSLVEQAYQWSKLGFSINEALELAQASTVFMKVADVGQDQALSNLVTTLKAFRIEADQTMDVVDKLDKLNNRYAVSASGLGQGLERAASTMAMSGNTLEETLAMLTGAGEITQSLEETGNGIKILSLRLRGMKGALEELNEPVDDLMEVSKVQTQILNLTHNQVNIFDEATQEFRSTYDIMKDISDIWDSLSSTSRSNLTEILFGKQRSNIGLALIQAFQSGQVQNAFEDATDAAGTATEEYEKMMNGIQAQFDALKGAVQEFSNAFINSEFLKGLVNIAKDFVNLLTLITDKTSALVVVLTPLLAFLGGKYKIGIGSIVAGIRSLAVAEGEATVATGALATAWVTLKGAITGLAISAIIAVITWIADKLIVTESEVKASIDDITNSVDELATATKDLKNAQSDIENTIASYSKIATTVADVNDRKTQLLELQNNLQDTYKDEADGIDLINGKYSEQIKKLQELAEEERKQYEIENADKIAKARRLSALSVTDIESTETSEGTKYVRFDWKKDADRALFTLTKLNSEAIDVAKNIEGVYESYYDGTLYLSGTLEDARNQLGLIIENYSKFADENDKSLEALISRYKELGGLLEDINEVSSYIENSTPKHSGWFGDIVDSNFGTEINDVLDKAFWQPFYSKLDEAQEKLKQLANPSDLSISEYDTLYRGVQNLEHELYKMAEYSESAKQIVADLFNGFKQGISENGDHLEQFMEQFNTTLEESFKSVAETVTNVQDALNNLAEGKGLSHNEAWKLLKEDTDGYLQSIKLVNGEYFFSQEELIKFKDAKIQASIETLKASNEEYKQEAENLTKQLEMLKENLKVQLGIYNLKVMQRTASQSDLKEIDKIKIDISETEASIKRCGDLWKRNNYLIEELNQNLGDTRTLSLATETELNNAIKGFENEVKAIEDTVDELNNRKDILESEKNELQNQLELLKEQKKELEDQQKTLKDAVEKYMKRYEESLKTQLDAIKQQKDDIKDEYDERIKALKNENEERDLAYKKEKALLDLNKAKQQQVRTYSSARGWEYGVSKEKLTEAQKNLDDVLMDEQIHALEKERDEKVSALEKQEKEYDKRIKAYQEYAQKYEETTEIIENADGELLAEQLLGADWREKIEKQDEGLLASYKKEYSKFADEIDRLTKNEIADIEASIKAKEAEIDKIGEEIKAYNNYKDTVKKRLDEAKEALEEYKNSVETAKTDVANAMNGMADAFDSAENRILDKHNRIIQWFNEIREAAEQLDDIAGMGAASAAAMGLHILGSHANGGVADYTGLAMLHGSKSNPETIFNASDSKKLYDMIHNTPNLIASVAKQAGQIAGFSPSNIKNSTNNSNISVNIGQVVANNPQELTRSLDTHLDSYFRRKLTQGYTQ